MPFQISALPKATFEPLFTLTGAELHARGARRVTAAKKPGYPCRVSLEDAEVGEEVLLVHYEHQPAGTPFRASHAVYVRPHSQQAHMAPGEVPDQLRTRTLSLRAFDESGMMIEADLAEGTALEPALTRLLESEQTAYIHIHYAKPGCYAALCTRA